VDLRGVPGGRSQKEKGCKKKGSGSSTWVVRKKAIQEYDDPRPGNLGIGPKCRPEAPGRPKVKKKRHHLPNLNGTYPIPVVLTFAPKKGSGRGGGNKPLVLPCSLKTFGPNYRHKSQWYREKWERWLSGGWVGVGILTISTLGKELGEAAVIRACRPSPWSSREREIGEGASESKGWRHRRP